MFADRARIFIRSGKGGDGHVSFRRELYVPDGGPDGGDGGKGGDLIFVVDPGLNTLVDYRHKRKYCAGDGKEGSKKRCTGASGEDMILKVPAGTVVKDAETGKVILDMANRTEPVVLLKGGRGGKGNQHYATATMQAPKYAQPGQRARELWVDLELKVIADVGLIGFPNVGKSTLLSRVTNARPKIANYHFTTLNPNLGVVDLAEGNGFVIADIPGIIEGASEGVGLGYQFLRHIERTKVMIHLVDAASVEGRDPIEDIKAINKELEAYNPELAKRPQVIAANKMDAMPEEDREVIIEMLEEAFADKDIKIFPISAVSGQGVKELLWYVNDLLKELPEEELYDEDRIESHVLYKFKRDDKYTITKEDDVWVIHGAEIEKLFKMTKFSSEEAVLRFAKKLARMGIDAKLDELGAKEGDQVRILDFYFDYRK